MRGRRATRRVGVAARIAAVLVAWSLLTMAAAAQSKPYKPKNGVLNWKAILLGGAFRVTTAIPLHGNFSKYSRIEIARTKSVIGPDVPEAFLAQITNRLATDFRNGGRFEDVSVVEGYERPDAVAIETVDAVSQTFRDADPLDAPLRSAAEMTRFDRERDAAEREPAHDSTLVVTSEVIDYARGNKFLQLLAMDLGNGVLTLRFSYWDKLTGEELGRSVVSSDNSSKVVPSLLSPRTSLSGVSEGLVDQVTRRKVAAER
jgi:hypothetical protein